MPIQSVSSCLPIGQQVPRQQYYTQYYAQYYQGNSNSVITNDATTNVDNQTQPESTISLANEIVSTEEDKVNTNSDWTEVVDETSGATYFYNSITGESTWGPQPIS